MLVGPDEKAHPVVAGDWRRFHVTVGHHLAPAWDKLPDFMARFSKVYAPWVRDTGPGLVACAAAHHRLVWIHPWADGNGRVARLFSEAWLIRARVDAHGLWSVSRGLARRLTDYRTCLANADAKRRRKQVPLLVGNIGPATFGQDDNALLLVDAHGHVELPRASKQDLARQLVAEIAKRLG